MATKSILKQVTIRNDKSGKMLANALEHAANKKVKEVDVRKPHIASVEDVKEMFSLG